MSVLRGSKATPGVAGGGKDASPVGVASRRSRSSPAANWRWRARCGPRLHRLGAPVTVMVTSFVAPSPSRAICCASDSITPAMASSTRRAVPSGSGRTPEAPLASSSERVVGGGVAVHRDAVVAALHAALQHGAQWRHRNQRRRSSRSPSVVAISGWIMPVPLVMPAIRTVPRRSLTSANAVLGTRSVVMMARATSSKRSADSPLTRRGSASVILLRIQFHADHAGGRGQHLVTPAGAAVWPRPCSVASATASPVRVAQLALPALTRMAPTSPCDAFRWLPRQPHRRGLHAVLREHGGGGGGQSGDDQRQVVLLHLRECRRRWRHRRNPAEGSTACFS